MCGVGVFVCVVVHDLCCVFFWFCFVFVVHFFIWYCFAGFLVGLIVVLCCNLWCLLGVFCVCDVWVVCVCVLCVVHCLF